MSASAQPPASLTHFSPAELDMLAKTADALSAYLGKPVLAEVALGDEGTEWVTFGVALDTDADETDDAAPHVQMGGAGARLLGGRGGLPTPTRKAMTACICGRCRFRSSKASVSSSWTRTATNAPGRTSSPMCCRSR